VGVLYRSLRLKDPNSALYGRPYVEVGLKPLSRELAREFLIKGVEQEGIEPPYDLIEEAIEVFNGIIGWLTYFGLNMRG